MPMSKRLPFPQIHCYEQYCAWLIQKQMIAIIQYTNISKWLNKLRSYISSAPPKPAQTPKVTPNRQSYRIKSLRSPTVCKIPSAEIQLSQADSCTFCPR